MDARKQGETVELCLSNEVTCPQPNGVSPADISVYRYDSTYDNELIWEASPPDPDTNQKISGIVTYGVPPKGWSNRMTPPALVCGKAYLVNPPATYFGLKCDGTVVAFDPPDLERFFREEALAAQRKKGSAN